MTIVLLIQTFNKDTIQMWKIMRFFFLLLTNLDHTEFPLNAPKVVRCVPMLKNAKKKNIFTAYIYFPRNIRLTAVRIQHLTFCLTDSAHVYVSKTSLSRFNKLQFRMKTLKFGTQ